MIPLFRSSFYCCFYFKFILTKFWIKCVCILSNWYIKTFSFVVVAVKFHKWNFANDCIQHAIRSLTTVRSMQSIKNAWITQTQSDFAHKFPDLSTSNWFRLRFRSAKLMRKKKKKTKESISVFNGYKLYDLVTFLPTFLYSSPNFSTLIFICYIFSLFQFFYWCIFIVIKLFGYSIEVKKKTLSEHFIWTAMHGIKLLFDAIILCLDLLFLVLELMLFHKFYRIFWI